jgi:hypothetical protein
MPSTYEPIATNTLGSAAASVTFSSIPSTYTDIVLIQNSTGAGGAGASHLRFNGDTGANYSRTRLLGNGTAASSYRESSANYIASDAPNSSISTTIWNIMNYANTTTNQTVLYRDNSTAFVVGQVGLWRNTAAVTSLSITADAGTFAAGSTFTLYGVKSA